MNTKLAFVLVLFALLSSLLLMRLYPIEVKAPNSHRVHNLDTALNYTTIQEAINDVATSNGHTIFVEEGIYYEHVVVGKSLSLVGENQYSTIIDGNGTDTVVHVTADSVTIRRFSIKNGSIGIHIDNSSGSLISENSIIDNYGDAVLIDYSTNCNVYSNVVGNNTDRGILVTETQNFIISGNTVYGSKEMYGINANSSTNGLIARNNVYENAFDGIGIVSSSICTVVANNVNDNPLYGIYIDESSDSFIYHNNIVNNSIQAAVTNSTIHWDDGIEGNYWSDYNGTDADQNGIGDSPYNIFEGGGLYADSLPLMGRFSGFKTSFEYQVNIISNSSVSNFGFYLVNSSYAALTFNVRGEIGSQGFCRLRIPKVLINGSYNVRFDGIIVTYPQVRELQPSNETFEYLYINYAHSDHVIEISGTTTIPELSPLTMIVFLMVATLFAIMIYRRKPPFVHLKN